MRVLAVTGLFPNPLQPQRAPFNLQQLRALAATQEVRVIAPVAWTGEWMAGDARAMPADRRVLRDGMVVEHPRYLFTPRVLRGMYGRFFMHSIAARFEAAAREFRPDVVLGCWAYPDGWAAVRLARAAGIPVAVKVHGSDLLTVRPGSVRERRAAEALADADAVIAVSEGLRARAVALGASEERVHLVRNGVDTALFAPGDGAAARESLGIEPGAELVLFVGNLVEVKGPDILLRAFARLAHQRPRLRCAFVGAGPLERRLRSLSGEVGVSDRVRFAGSRPLAELPMWYRAADCLVLPSRSEGIPNVLLEASACGTPWVAARVGGVPEIAPPESLVPAGDEGALAAAMNDLLGSRRRPPAAVGSWSDSAAAMAGVLASIVERRARERRRTA